ncbi:MAG: autotransporter outer membrane beta-barrel domain-containing protein [Candidatus Omnitrophica bacterium]|nr:autotransporter outer membrane beta-barrel domain-containing protein [Candidatus Omnitrophota bacterium]
MSFTAAGIADLILTSARATNAYAGASTNPNTEAVGAVLDAIAAGNPTGDMLTVLNLLDQMGSAEEVSDAMETMEPDVSSGAADASRALTGQGFTMISNRLGGARNGGAASSGVSSGDMTNGMGVWIQGLGSHLRQDMRKGIEGYKANTFGTTIGVDKVLDKHFRLGLAGGYGWARVNSKTPGSPSDDINSWQGTVYGSYDSLDLCKARQGGKKSYEAVRNQGDNFWYVDGMFAFTQNNYDSRREIWLGALKRVAKADHGAQQYSSKMEFGYTMTFKETKALEVTPFTSIGYNYLYMNKYKEDGAGALNLTVDGEGFHQLEQGLGTKFAYPIVAKNAGTFIPSIKGAWLYDYMGDRFETTASFAGGGPSFNTRGAKPAKSGLLLGAELAFLNKGNLTLTGNWDMELKDEFMSNTYYGTVRYDF